MICVRSFRSSATSPGWVGSLQLSGGVARRLAQPPANFWQASGLLPHPHPGGMKDISRGLNEVIPPDGCRNKQPTLKGWQKSADVQIAVEVVL